MSGFSAWKSPSKMPNEEAGKRQIAPKWSDKDALTIIKAYGENSNARGNAAWEVIASNYGLTYTAEQCRGKIASLRKDYLKSVKSNETFESKFFDELKVVLRKPYDTSKKTAKSSIPVEAPTMGPTTICRCCGQIEENLINLCDEIDGSVPIIWFLTLTNLNESTFCSQFVKICAGCLIKLETAHKFLQQCLMSESLLREEIKKTTVVDETQLIVTVDEEVFGEEEVVEEEFLQEEEVVEEGKVTALMKKRFKEAHFECDYCHTTFPSAKQLKEHTKFHKITKDYVCKECNKRFATWTGLTYHISTVHDENLKKHLCTICGAKMPTLASLRHHMNKHTDTKPFECKDCEMKFFRRNALTGHIRSFHENVTYDCQYCGATYKSNKYKLKFHVLLKHEGAKLRCNVCLTEPGSMKTLIKHLKQVHNTGFDQSVHVILPTKEKLMRRRKMHDTIIQTEVVEDEEEEEYVV